MPFTGIYNPEQLAVLSKVLDEHCQNLGIERPGPDYEDASYLLMALSRKGAQTAEELKAALDAAMTGSEWRDRLNGTFEPDGIGDETRWHPVGPASTRPVDSGLRQTMRRRYRSGRFLEHRGPARFEE